MTNQQPSSDGWEMRAAEAIVPVLCVSREAEMERRLIQRAASLIAAHAPKESANERVMHKLQAIASFAAYADMRKDAPIMDVAVQLEVQLAECFKLANQALDLASYAAQPSERERELVDALRKAIDAISSIDEATGLPPHEDGCPEDDTCECALYCHIRDASKILAKHGGAS